jgi:hypothetical protein
MTQYLAGRDPYLKTCADSVLMQAPVFKQECILLAKKFILTYPNYNRETFLKAIIDLESM